MNRRNFFQRIGAAIAGVAIAPLPVECVGAARVTLPFIEKIDDYTGFPVTPNLGDITITWPGDSIFTL